MVMVWYYNQVRFFTRLLQLGQILILILDNSQSTAGRLGDGLLLKIVPVVLISVGGMSHLMLAQLPSIISVAQHAKFGST